MNGNDRSQFFTTVLVCFSLVHFCITIYLVVTVYSLAAFIEDVNSHVAMSRASHPNRHDKRSNAFLEELIKIQSQLILDQYANSSRSCGHDFNKTDHQCACLYPATISKTGTSRVAVVLTKDIILPCPATGHPVPYVTWTKNGNTMRYNSRLIQTNNGLQIKGIQLSDVGNYTCKARNVLGVDTRVIFVEIAV